MTELMTEPMKKLSASSRQDVPVRLVAWVLSVSKVGQWLPTPAAAGYRNTAPVTCTISPSHHCAHTPSSFLTTKQGLQHTVTLQFTAHPVVIPVLPGSSIVPLCSLSPAAWSGVLVYLVFHSCASKEVKMEKAWIITVQQERDAAACFPARAGNWTSTIRTGFLSCLSLCHCAAGRHTGEMYAGSWWGCEADTLTRIPVTQEALPPDWRRNQQ